MDKIKGMRVLNKAISAELKPFGISEAVCGDEYNYSLDKESVMFKLTENTIEDILFCEYVKERFNYNIRHIFVFSLLHEIGHHKTYDDITGSVYDFCENEKERIAGDMITADDEDAKKLEWQYFNLPDEIIATQWAVNYAKNHPKKVEKMWQKMKTALFEFYKKNGVFDEIDNE